jgi:hypothetical protein
VVVVAVWFNISVGEGMEGNEPQLQVWFIFVVSCILPHIGVQFSMASCHSICEGRGSCASTLFNMAALARQHLCIVRYVRVGLGL